MAGSQGKNWVYQAMNEIDESNENSHLIAKRQNKIDINLFLFLQL